jgi:broad specificity phosphatase PhoE
MKIYFVRHGKTPSNKLKRIMSRSNDESLDNDGLSEVRQVISDKANDMDYDIVFSSTLKRASETAAEFANFKKAPLHHNEDIIELEFGKLSNKTWEEISTITDGKLNYEIWKSVMGFDLSPYGGETKDAAVNRVKRFIQYLKTNHANSKPLVVTHGGVLRTLNGLYPEYKSDGFKNASIHIFEV